MFVHAIFLCQAARMIKREMMIARLPTEIVGNCRIQAPERIPNRL